MTVARVLRWIARKWFVLQRIGSRLSYLNACSLNSALRVFSIRVVTYLCGLYVNSNNAMVTNVKYISLGLFLLGASVGMLSCSTSSTPVPQLPLVTGTFTNLPADPPSGGYVNNVPVGITRKFTLFSFSTGAIVPNSDSVSTNWDLGFNGVTIIVNNGTSGPGFAGAQVVTGVYDLMSVAPTTGYFSDNKNNTASPLAIPKGSGNGWYTYDATSNIVTPISNRAIIMKTADAKHYVKMQIISYYKDAPASPNSSSVDRYYTFRYTYNPNTTTALK